MDPFLLTHRVKNQEILYDLGPGFAPISIRDQMLRSAALTVRALNTGLIGPDRHFLVVGAGAAGATAAMIASSNKVPTTIIDRAPQAFGRQLSCPSRYVCPTQYDWPAEHWRERKFPLTTPAMPLEWQSGRAAGIALAWENKLLRWEKELEKNFPANPPLQVLRGYKLDKRWSVSADKKLLTASFINLSDSSTLGPYNFAMALSCVGQGNENCKIDEKDDFTGYQFWQEEQYSEDDLGLPAGQQPRVLISGAGDGALQDFLRIVTNLEAPQDIFDLLPAEVQVKVEKAVHTAEDQAQRAYIWSTSAYDHRLLQELHERYERVVRDVLNGPHKKGVEAALKGIMGHRPGHLEIKLVHECTHFSRCYGLNRFLVLLIAEYMRDEYGDILHPSTRIVKIAGTGAHTGAQACQKDRPDLCHGQDHDVYFKTVNCDTLKGHKSYTAGDLMLHGGPYNVIILRHGIAGDSRQYLFNDPPESNPRHMLPYYWSW